MADLIEAVPRSLLSDDHLDITRYSPAIADLIERQSPYPKEFLPLLAAATTGLVSAIYLSKRAAERAYSWRDYRVGAVALAYNFADNTFGTLRGYNFKTSANKADVDVHAEQMAIAKARASGLNQVLGIGIWADPNDQDANPSSAPTLRPCQRCSDMFEAVPEVSTNTFIMSAGGDFTQCEIYTAGELAEYYTNDQEAPAPGELEPFSLATNADCDKFDRTILPVLHQKIGELLSVNW